MNHHGEVKLENLLIYLPNRGSHHSHMCLSDSEYSDAFYTALEKWKHTKEQRRPRLQTCGCTDAPSTNSSHCIQHSYAIHILCWSQRTSTILIKVQTAEACHACQMRDHRIVHADQSDQWSTIHHPNLMECYM